MSKENLTLYQTEECPYSAMVRHKLDELGLAYRIQPVPHDSAKRDELKALSGQILVPALQDGDQVIVGSQTINIHLDKAYGSGSPTALTPFNYGIECEIQGETQEVYQKVVETFKGQGFGLITEINVQKTMKEKLDKDTEPNWILGFCNPKLAHQGMTAEFDLGLLLPCNVILRETKPGSFKVSAVNPVKMFSIVGRDDMVEMANEVKEMLKGGIAKLQQG